MKNAVRSDTRAACCMLWVTITIEYSLLELEHQVLDPAGGDRVERRARLVHQDHVGLDGERAGDAEALLLAAGHAEGVRLEAVLDLVPQRRARRARSTISSMSPFIPSTRGPKAMLS